MEDQLRAMNRSELRQIALEAGFGNLTIALDKDALIEILVDDFETEDDEMQPWRRAMEQHIAENLDRLRSQLPGCAGRCTSHGCPAVIVSRCWGGFSRDMV